MEQYGRASAPLVMHRIASIEYLTEIYSKVLKFHIPPDGISFGEISNIGELSPHIDPKSKVALNCYLAPANCTTTFYKLINTGTEFCSTNSLNSEYHSTNSIAKAYQLSDLLPLCSFVAEKNDIYLMDTSTIHSVLKPDITLRQFISFRWWNYLYNDIIGSIEIL